MKGIEAAFQGALGKDPELKTSKSGTPYAGLSVVVTVGKDDDGKDVGQWIRVTCFKETAQHIAAAAKKGSRLYCEGSLSLDTWTAGNGEQRTGLSCAAWKVVILGEIGEKRPRKSSAPADNGAANKGAGRIFDDPLPF